MKMDASALIAMVGFVLNLIVLAVGGVWKLSRVEAALRQALQEHQTKTGEDLERIRREFGEVVAALRQKITEVELYIRDNYVRRHSFYEVTAKMSGDLKEMGDRLEARISRFEEKLDRINARKEGRETDRQNEPA